MDGLVLDHLQTKPNKICLVINHHHMILCFHHKTMNSLKQRRSIQNNQEAQIIELWNFYVNLKDKSNPNRKKKEKQSFLYGCFVCYLIIGKTFLYFLPAYHFCHKYILQTPNWLAYYIERQSNIMFHRKRLSNG